MPPPQLTSLTRNPPAFPAADEVHHLSWGGANGRYLAASGSGGVDLFRRNSDTLTHVSSTGATAPDEAVSGNMGAQFDPDGVLLVSTDGPGRILVHQRVGDTLSLISTVTVASTDTLTCGPAWSADGVHLVTSDSNGSTNRLQVWKRTGTTVTHLATVTNATRFPSAHGGIPVWLYDDDYLALVPDVAHWGGAAGVGLVKRVGDTFTFIASTLPAAVTKPVARFGSIELGELSPPQASRNQLTGRDPINRITGITNREQRLIEQTTDAATFGDGPLFTSTRFGYYESSIDLYQNPIDSATHSASPLWAWWPPNDGYAIFASLPPGATGYLHIGGIGTIPPQWSGLERHGVAANTNSVTVVMDVPTTRAIHTGEILIACVSSSNPITATVTDPGWATPAGWTLLSTQAQTGARVVLRSSIYYKVIDEEEPDSYSWFTTSGFSYRNIEASVIWITGCPHGVPPIDVSAQGGTPVGVGPINAVFAPSVTLPACQDNMHAVLAFDCHYFDTVSGYDGTFETRIAEFNSSAGGFFEGQYVSWSAWTTLGATGTAQWNSTVTPTIPNEANVHRVAIPQAGAPKMFDRTPGVFATVMHGVSLQDGEDGAGYGETAPANVTKDNLYLPSLVLTRDGAYGAYSASILHVLYGDYGGHHRAIEWFKTNVATPDLEPTDVGNWSVGAISIG